MAKTAFNPEGLPVPRGSYSLVNVAQPGRMVFIAGQTASDHEGKVVGVGDAKAQTRFILGKIQRASPSRRQRNAARGLGIELPDQHNGAGSGAGAPRAAARNQRHRGYFLTPQSLRLPNLALRRLNGVDSSMSKMESRVIEGLVWIVADLRN